MTCQPILNQLRETKLLRQGSFIGGAWYPLEGAKLEVVNPWNGKRIAEVADSSEQEATRAVEAAKLAQKEWQLKPAKARSAVLKRWFELVVEHKEDLAIILTSEQGKPISEARAEIQYGANYIEWFAEQIKRVEGSVIPSASPAQQIITLKQPVGVVAAITPWNFPMAMLARKLAPALGVGCTVVAKPASQTPLSALALGYLAEQAGVTSGALNIVVSSLAKEVGQILTQHQSVRKITFTGSTAVGKTLLRQAASTVKHSSMELGGNAPFIVYEDADLSAAVKGCMAAKFRNAGQTCVCVNRILVHEKVFPAFAKLLKEAVSKLSVGNGMQDGVDIGPLINQSAIDKVSALVKSAVEAGAEAVVHESHDGIDTHRFYPPTILLKATPTMDIFSEEIFGPVAVLYSFRSDEEAMELANNSSSGLAGYFYSKDIHRVWRVAAELEVGMVGVNDTAISNEMAPFGGVKESGFGREGGQQGVEDYLETKYILMGR